MKKFFAIPLAVLFVAACSETSTAPVSSTTDIAPSYGRKTTPVLPDCTNNCLVADAYDFESGISGSSGQASIGTDIQPGELSAADAPAVITSPSDSSFIGRFENTRTMVTINIPAGNANYNLKFDFYTIGSWDGRGKQAQNGIFEANVFDLGYRCNGSTGATTSIFKTSFSNQLTVQQDYPNSYLTGGFKAATGSYATEALGYRGDPSSNTPLFRSFSDVSYHMAFAGENPCGTQAIQFTISTSNPTQQNVYDESWGVDNIIVHAWN